MEGEGERSHRVPRSWEQFMHKPSRRRFEFLLALTPSGTKHPPSNLVVLLRARAIANSFSGTLFSRMCAAPLAIRAQAACRVLSHLFILKKVTGDEMALSTVRGD